MVGAAWGKLAAPGKSKRGGNRQDREGKGGNRGLGEGKKKPKRENPRERKIEMLSEAITSKRSKKAQDCSIRGKFYPVEQAQVFHSCSSISSLWQWRVSPDRGSRAAQEHDRAAPPPGSVTQNCCPWPDRIWGVEGQRG